jgi:hypothetical protein
MGSHNFKAKGIQQFFLYHHYSVMSEYPIADVNVLGSENLPWEDKKAS